MWSEPQILRPESQKMTPETFLSLAEVDGSPLLPW